MYCGDVHLWMIVADKVLQMMRFLTLIVMLVCMTASGNLYAEPAADDSETTTTQQTEEPEKHSPPVKQTPRKTTKPATTFKPSEKIGADSAVSFPVDI